MLWGINLVFRKAIPQLKVDCIRVTHPCAGRHQVLLLVLPLDLHVLSLPLAFILSQDQTLHCIKLFDLWISIYPRNYLSLGSSLVCLIQIILLFQSYLLHFGFQSFQRTFYLFRFKIKDLRLKIHIFNPSVL